MLIKDIYYKLREKFGTEIADFNDQAKDPYITINANAVLDILRFLKEDQDMLFITLMNVSGVDLKTNFQIVYHLYSNKLNSRLVIKVLLDKSNIKLSSISMLWKGANWFEREIFDLFGIFFIDHPNLKRILLPEDWIGYPLRKDYEYPKHYQEIDNERKYECT